MRALIMQCGGPTVVINASLAAVIAGWNQAGGTLLGARMGTQGLASGDWVELPPMDGTTLQALAQQPGSALGSGRHLLDARETDAAVQLLRQRDIAVLFGVGGNGTMAALQRVSRASSTAGASLRVVGIPKTIDNDLVGSDVTPGYASAARFVAQSVRDAGLDLRAMANFEDVVLVEIMGRHVGWLAAATALARHSAGDPPHLILLPEAPVDETDLMQRIAEIHAAKGICLVAAAEGVADRAGVYLAEKVDGGQHDGSGQRVFSMGLGVAAYLAQEVESRLGLRCRQLRPSTLQRSSGALASDVDRDLAWLAGAAGVHAALGNCNEVVISLQREGDRWTTRTMPFVEVVGKEKRMPAEFIREDGLGVTAAFEAWCLSLVGSLSPTPRLWFEEG